MLGLVHLLKPIIVTFITLFLLSWLLPVINYSDWLSLFLASLVLTILQKIVRPILGILFLPINIVTLGLFSWVLNVVILWLATYLVPGFEIKEMILFGVGLNSFWSLLVVSLLISFCQSLLSFFL
jgi:putative membrane protein